MATDARGIAFFASPSRIVLYPVIANVPPPPSWKVLLWHKYTSFATFQQDVDAGTVPRGTEIVGYDDEKWHLTPANEQADPIGYTIKFARLAHAHGYKVIAMPAENLMQALSPERDKFAGFLGFGMAKAVAPYIDFYHIQAQGLQQNIDGAPPSFMSFVRQVADQVHSANAKVIVTAGISTNTPGAARSTTPDDMAAAVRAVDPIVSGYWLNIVGGASQVAADALSRITTPDP